MDSRLRVYDEAGLFEPDVVRTLKHDGTRWLFDHPDFSDWVFEKTKPTFIVTHDFWTYVTAFEKDARFERDYAPIDAYPDRYVDAVYKARLRSGIYVRRDALAAPEDIDRARESYVASPAREPLVWRLRLAFGLDPGSARGTDDDLRKRAMAARYQDQNPNRAATLFAQLAERKPDDLESHTELGDALDAAGRADEARPAWKAALTLARARKDTFHTTLAADRLRGAPPPPPTDDEQGHLMQAGIDALYTQHDPAKAVDLFRKVLALNPQHYGASYQLAVALDAAGRKGEARALWPEVLEMASHLKDEKTMQDVAARIASGG
jgi:tetratricopeptide (TPR) repeat protein